MTQTAIPVEIDKEKIIKELDNLNPRGWHSTLADRINHTKQGVRAWATIDHRKSPRIEAGALIFLSESREVARVRKRFSTMY